MKDIHVAVLATESCIQNNDWLEIKKQAGLNITLFKDQRVFIAHCIEERPHILCVSLNNSFDKIKRLPQALRKSLDVPVLSFLETESKDLLAALAMEPVDQVIQNFQIKTLKEVVENWRPICDLVNQPSLPDEDEKLAILDDLYMNLGEKKTSLNLDKPDQEIKPDLGQQETTSDDIDIDQVLESICQESFEKTVEARVVRQSKDFSIQKSAVYTIVMANYQGLLTLAYEQGIDDQNTIMENFYRQLIEGFKLRNIEARIEGPFIISSQTSHFIESYSNFSEFIFHYDNQETGQWCLSFIKREMIQPKLEQTTDGTMLKMSIKALPPETPVTFSAYLRLPINKKYVKYLKEGAQINIEQVKRHSKQEHKSHIYIPVEDREKIIQFYIQNTINWELALNEKEPVAS